MTITVLAEYSDFANVFSEKLAAILLKYTEIKIHAINLKKDKQLLYRLIYSLELVKREILKTYIKTNQANGFIYFLKSPISALILSE